MRNERCSLMLLLGLRATRAAGARSTGARRTTAGAAAPRVIFPDGFVVVRRDRRGRRDCARRG